MALNFEPSYEHRMNTARIRVVLPLPGGHEFLRDSIQAASSQGKRLMISDAAEAAPNGAGAIRATFWIFLTIQNKLSEPGVAMRWRHQMMPCVVSPLWVLVEYRVAQHSKMRAVGDKPIVFVVDDDQDYRDSLGALFNLVDLKVKLFGSATELLGRQLPDVVNCLVVDVRLPELSGRDFQAGLSNANISIPVTFMTGYSDVPMSVKAMKAGAVDFLSKPFRDQDMLDAVTIALDRDRKRRNAERRLADLRSRLEGLSQ